MVGNLLLVVDGKAFLKKKVPDKQLHEATTRFQYGCNSIPWINFFSGSRRCLFFNKESRKELLVGLDLEVQHKPY